MNLHSYVLFVGDKPCKDNISIYVPFVGARSYKRLLEWMYEMDVDVTRIGFVNAVHVKAADLKQADRVVALGTVAAKAVREYRRDLFELPHPSGKNRVINNKKLMKEALEQCKKYIYGGK